MVCEPPDPRSKLYRVEFRENIPFYPLKLENDTIGSGRVICLTRHIASHVFMTISK